MTDEDGVLLVYSVTLSESFFFVLLISVGITLACKESRNSNEQAGGLRQAIYIHIYITKNFLVFKAMYTGLCFSFLLSWIFEYLCTYFLFLPTSFIASSAHPPPGKKNLCNRNRCAKAARVGAVAKGRFLQQDFVCRLGGRRAGRFLRSLRRGLSFFVGHPPPQGHMHLDALRFLLAACCIHSTTL